MSLILEALKKSEANRRLGQAPDLGTPFTSTRRERSPVWALIVIVLSLCAGLWWWFGRGASAPAPAKPPVAAAPSTATHVGATVPSQRAASARSVPARKPAPAVQDAGASGFGPPPPGAPRNAAQTQDEDQRIFQAARMREQSQRGAGAPVTAPPAVAATSPPSHPIAAPAPQMAPPPPATKAQAARAPAAPPAQPTHVPTGPPQTRDSTPPPEPHAQAAPPPQPTATAAKTDVPAYYDLPFATRKALPQLSLSMHVYTADPKLRFVILDGTRMAEGDTTPDNVTVREIRPDGVVLEFQGQRFFYPRDGL